MKEDTIITIVGIAIAAAVIIPKVYGSTGQAIGAAVVNTSAGVITGAVKAIPQAVWQDPYDWAKSYQGYIPVIDDIAWLFSNKSNPDAYQGIFK